MTPARLLYIQSNPASVLEKEIDVLEELCVEFPFFALPFEILTRIYKEKQSYKYDKLLKKASLRCLDRSVLYAYVHDKNTLSESDKVDNSDVPELVVASTSETKKDNEEGLQEFKIENPIELVIQEKVITEELEEKEVKSEVEEPIFMNEIEEVQVTEKDENNQDTLIQVQVDDDSKVVIESTASELTFSDWLQKIAKTSGEGMKEIASPKQKAFSDLKEVTAQKEKGYVDNKLRIKETHVIEPSNEKVEQTLQVIESFLKTNPVISHPKTEFFKAEKAAKKSLELHGGIVTETLARIYVKQGHIEQAIWAYEKLSLKFPQKEAYFANLINELKNKE